MKKEAEIRVGVPTPSKNGVVEAVEKEIPYLPHPPCKPKIPFPKRSVKDKVEAQYTKFMDIIKKFYVNVPLLKYYPKCWLM